MLNKAEDRAEEDSEFARASEEERVLYSLMIRLKLSDLETKHRHRFPQQLDKVKIIEC